MTDFYAVYLFVVIAVVLLGMGLWFKKGWVTVLSSVGWLMTAFYCFGIATSATPYIRYFAVFCLAASIGTIIVSMTANRKAPVPPPAEVSNSDQILANAERVRALRGKHKMQNQKGLF